MKKHQILLPTFLLIVSCSQFGRNIASNTLSPPKLDNLVRASEEILQDVGHDSFPEACVDYMKTLEDNLAELDVRSLSVEQLIIDADVISKNTWGIRSKLHSRLSEFDKDCAIQLQANFRQFRFIEDYVLEISRKITSHEPKDIDFQKQPIPVLDVTVPFYELKLNAQKEFQPGDIFITRGVSFLSGMIARLGKRATQFSHVVMLYEDPQTKKLKTMESYVGVGVSTYDVDFALRNENARILWLRAKDKDLGRRASEAFYKLYKEKSPIKYDYELDFKDNSTMSCAEVSQVGFQLVDENFRIPYYPNEISGNNSIIERLKLVKGEVYEPGDMEIDPRFELVGEFQDLRITRDSRQKDAVMTAIFDWMENKHYTLRDNFKSKMAGSVIYTARKTFLWPLVKKVLKLDDFSKEIPRHMVKTLSLVNDLGGAIHQELKKKDLEFEKTYGVPMSYTDYYRTLEEMRVRDLELYENKKTRKKSKFHKIIRPGK